MSVQLNQSSPDVNCTPNILSGGVHQCKSSRKNWQIKSQEPIDWTQFKPKDQGKESLLETSSHSNSTQSGTAGVTTEGKVTGNIQRQTDKAAPQKQSQQQWRVKTPISVPPVEGPSARPLKADIPIEKGANNVVQTKEITTTVATTVHHQQENQAPVPQPKVQNTAGSPNQSNNINNKQQQKVYQPRYANNKQINAAKKRLDDILKQKDIDEFDDTKVIIRITTQNGSWGLIKKDLTNANLDIRKAIIENINRQKPENKTQEIYKDMIHGTDNLELHKNDVDKIAFAEREQKIGDGLKNFRIDGATDTQVAEPRWLLIYASLIIFSFMVLYNIKRIGLFSSIIKSIWSFDIITPLVEWVIIALIDLFPQISILLSILDLVRFLQTLGFVGFMIEAVVFKLFLKIQVIYNLFYVSKIRRDVVKVHRFQPFQLYGTEKLAHNHITGLRVTESDVRTDNQKRSVINHQPLLVLTKYKVRARIADIIYFNVRAFFYKDWNTEYPGGLCLTFVYNVIALLRKLIYTEKEFWTLEKNKWLTRRMLIDAELMSQVTAAEVINISMDPQLAFDRLVERSKSFSTINLDRYFTLSGQRGEQIVSDTAMVAYAWYMEKCNQHSRSVFPKAPKM